MTIVLRELDSFKRVTSWEEWYQVTKDTFPEYFGVLAVPPMQRFIYSQYYARPELIVLPIAFCQFLIGIELFFDEKSHRLRKIAIPSLITFFIGLVFLGLGSAFPSSLLYAFTMANCWPKVTRSKIE